jgi:hypothetical protein
MPDLNNQLSSIERKIEAVEVKLRECSDQEEKKHLFFLLRSQEEEKLILLRSQELKERSQEEEKLILLRSQELKVRSQQLKEEKELILLRSQERAGKFLKNKFPSFKVFNAAFNQRMMTVSA